MGFEGVLLGRSEFGRDEDRGNVRLPMGKDVDEAVQVGLWDEEGRAAFAKRSASASESPFGAAMPSQA